ncbi:MAG: site-2 protease family protein, partial [Myxococcales bacterium]|nr:site-2 protease family protein [Myxococcales bacterium]
MTVALYLVAILGIAVLMIVHEAGHCIAARRFGMTVIRFSIGFGPTIWRHRPKGSPTVYQIALIPFLAYVQIAGMNPYEEVDPNDKGSYANAKLWPRIVTIAAGPLTNYFFASVLVFFGLLIGGKEV